MVTKEKKNRRAPAAQPRRPKRKAEHRREAEYRRKPEPRRRPEPRKRPEPRRRPEEEEIVYTQPKPFQRRRFFLRLATVLAVVIAIVFGLSIFFKVENVTVSGAKRYTPWEVREAAGIRDGEHLLGISEAQISGNIISKLPYVGKVRVGINLPNTVNIEIEEMEREELYAIRDQADGWWLINSSGRFIQQTDGGAAGSYTKIDGVKVAEPEVGTDASAWQPEAVPETDAQGETLAPDPTLEAARPEQQKLDMALIIAKELESNNIKDKVASINVSDILHLEFWYGQRYQVQLGEGSGIPYKVNAAVMAIKQMSEYQSGVLDVSFTQWPDKVGYTPFE